RRDPLDCDVTYARDDGRALWREGRERADRIEPDGRSADIGVLEAVEAGGHLGGQQGTLHAEQGRDPGGVEGANRLRVLDPSEGPLDAVDVVDLRDGGGEVHDPLDVGLVGRRTVDVGQDDD